MGCGNETTLQSRGAVANEKSPEQIHTYTYFDGYARGENIRALLWKANIKYTDKRLTFSEWPALKATLPVKGLPIL